ncbi:hypothetical protein [Streptomyces venezuelae]|uniref:hypothetical protein n=1 Tax=Streptomyces venezuelae TaxID=54571 RepID=UPI00332646FC
MPDEAPVSADPAATAATAAYAAPGEGEKGEPARAGGGRYLIAVANTRNHKEPELDVPELADSREKIIRLFTERFGYEYVAEPGLDPPKDRLTQSLRSFCRSELRHPNDILAVYVAGHGRTLEDSGEHVLLTVDTDPEDLYDALQTALLARSMLRGTSLRRLLLLLDTCYSAHGTGESAVHALMHTTRQWQFDTGAGLALVSSSQHDEETPVGAFPHLLGQAVEELAAAPGGGPVLDLPSVVSAMNANPDKKAYHTVTLSQVGLTGLAPPFLPNPGYDPDVVPAAPLDNGPSLKAHYRQTLTTGEYELTTEFFLYTDTGVKYLLENQEKGRFLPPPQQGVNPDETEELGL